jgi:ABC-type Zn uptake system ZnuABC Zn-binding protein ZnuA
VLLGLIGLTAVATLSALGSLLSAALLIVPAASTRMWVREMRPWQLATVALAASEGALGLWLSVKANVPPGPAIAVLAGCVFALSVCAHQARAGWRQMRRHRVLLASAVVLTAGLLATGCSNNPAGGAEASDHPDVVATTTQLGDFAREVGGDDVDVHQILQPNADPHEYEPRPADVASTGAAKIVFLSGNNLDKWMGKVIDQSGGHPATVTIAPAHTPDKVRGESSGPEASKYDPHWWHDPRNAQAAVLTIRDALVKADPSARKRFDARAATYLAKLRTLDSGIAKCFQGLAPQKRKLVTGHDAFNYFARRYEIDVVGAVIPSQTTQAQPSAGALTRLVTLVRKQHVKAIFPENSINPKLARALAAETGAKATYTLYGDTLGAKGSAGETYLTMEQANANAMVEGFTSGKDHCRIAGL